MRRNITKNNESKMVLELKEWDIFGRKNTATTMK